MTVHDERMARFREAGLYLVTSAELSNGRSTVSIVRAALEGGVRLVQLREKALSVRELMKVGREVRDMTRARGALLLVNDRLDVAMALDADGVHLGQDDLPVGDARRIAPEMIIGASSHNEAEAVAAGDDGASYVNIGPLFATGTKPWTGDYLGVDGLRRIAPRVSVPFTVMGGIKPRHVAQVVAAGARTLAVVTAVTAAPDPAAATRELLAAIRDAGVRRG